QIEGKAVQARSTGDVLLSAGRKALGLEEGKGPLRWASFQDFLRAEWQKVARDCGSNAPFADFWDAALRRGGVWRTPTAPAISIRPEAGRIHPGAQRPGGEGATGAGV